MNKHNIFDCMKIVGSAPEPFQSEKIYVSTGAVDVDHIDYSKVDTVPYNDRPSRANLVAKPNDILFAKMHETKKTLLLDENTSENIYSTGFFAVRAIEEIITTKCLYHLICSDSFLNQKDKNCSGATQKAITNQGLKKIFISIPDLLKQEKLATVLDKIDHLLNTRRIQLLKLDELVKSRFVEMFGDVIFNSKNWKIYKLDDISTSRLGKMLDSKQQTGEYVFPYLANFNVQWFHFNIENLNTMDFNEVDQKEFQLEYGDLLVCEGGEIGRCAVWHNEVQPCFFQKALHRIRCNLEIVKPDYLSWWFKFNCDNGGFENIAGAKATIAHLPGIKLKALQIVVPPIELQNQFAIFVSQIDKSKLAIEKSIEKLEILKKSLMQEYFG
ncbi:MAG: restriction endonuclease subunit S [Clostridium sp.]|nr:restriction endonuclease subunit S [Clostridium sp.]